MKKTNLEAILKAAPNFSCIEDLCKSQGISTKTFYNYTKNDAEIRQKIVDSLGSRYSFSVSHVDNKQTITISIDDARKANHNSFSEQERRDITDIICYAVEKGITVTETCNQICIHPSTFFKWVNPDSPISFPYAHERYNSSKEVFKKKSSEDLVLTARKILKKKLAEQTVKNTTRYYKTKGVKGEDAILESYTEHEKIIPPDLQAVSLVLNNLDPEFRKATAGGQMQIEDKYRYMTEDELLEELRKETERTQLLSSKK